MGRLRRKKCVRPSFVPGTPDVRSDWLIRQRLAEALGHLPAEKTIAALKFLVKDEHPQVREAARLSLQKLV